MHPFESHLRAVTRRTFLQRSGVGLGAVALGSLLNDRLFAAGGPNPLAPRATHFPARAKRVIYLHMVGAPSQLDLFDPKPALRPLDGKPCPDDFIKGKRFAFLRGHPTLAASRFAFARHGRSGAEISELLPHLATVADELAFVKSVHTDEFNHAPAQLFLHTGFGRPGRPSAGSWVTYGLGSENENLPGFVTISPPIQFGSQNYGSAFLPAVFQGTRIGAQKESGSNSSISAFRADFEPFDLAKRDVARVSLV